MVDLCRRLQEHGEDFGEDGVLGRGPCRQRAVLRPCGGRAVGGVAGALVEEPVDGVQGLARIKVGVEQQGLPCSQDLGIEAASWGRGGGPAPSWQG
jgi:hypothetical protein